MKKQILSTALFAFILSSFGQTTVNFENVSLVDGVYNGADQSGGFESGGLRFKNVYDAQFQAWSGFGASNKTDSTTGTYANQYSCYAGGGAQGSEKYGVVYVFDPAIVKKASGTSQMLYLQSFQFTNSTWAGVTMKNGDAFCKKFGGPTGNDPDFFKLRVFNHYSGFITDSVDVYLADYRFTNNAADYIVKSWQTAQVNFTNPFDSVSFRLESTDNGTFGMNTPAYFCIDNLTYSIETSVASSQKNSDVIFPNPFENVLMVKHSGNGAEFQMVDVTGRQMACPMTRTGETTRIETQLLLPGVYFLKDSEGQTTKVVKH